MVLETGLILSEDYLGEKERQYETLSLFKTYQVENDSSMTDEELSLYISQLNQSLMTFISNISPAVELNPIWVQVMSILSNRAERISRHSNQMKVSGDELSRYDTAQFLVDFFLGLKVIKMVLADSGVSHSAFTQLTETYNHELTQIIQKPTKLLIV